MAVLLILKTLLSCLNRRCILSTTFNVLPTKIYMPTYKELLELANIRINAYLIGIGAKKEVNINVNLLDIRSNEALKFKIEDEILQNETNYAWFTVSNVPGGTDCYYYKNLPINEEVWAEEFKTNLNALNCKQKILRNLNLGYQWIFRRSAGQSPIITLAYGILSASLASLIDGVIYSDDGAWEYSRFPANANDFFSWYFRPELALEEEFKSFSSSCISLLKNDIYQWR